MVFSHYSFSLRDGHLSTPLHLAADKGYVEIISLLTHAPLEARDKSSVSAWVMVVKCSARTI